MVRRSTLNDSITIVSLINILMELLEFGRITTLSCRAFKNRNLKHDLDKYKVTASTDKFLNNVS